MKTGITFSAFDLLHTGHIKMLEEAKRQSEYLIAVLQTDPTIDRPEKTDLHKELWNVIFSLEALSMLMRLYPMLQNKI